MRSYVLPEKPFWFSISLGEIGLEDHLLILAFLCELIDKRFQESFLFL